jgi:isoleucyl-tRNA synthetase
VAGDEGLVVVLDTELTPDLVAEGDARELQRAIQDLRKDAGLELDDRIDLWVANAADDVAPYLAAVAAEVLADSLTLASPDGAAPATHGKLDLAGGPADIWIRRREEG